MRRAVLYGRRKMVLLYWLIDLARVVTPLLLIMVLVSYHYFIILIVLLIFMWVKRLFRVIRSVLLVKPVLKQGIIYIGKCVSIIYQLIPCSGLKWRYKMNTIH